jgi:hypothetical protein
MIYDTKLSPRENLRGSFGMAGSIAMAALTRGGLARLGYKLMRGKGITPAVIAGTGVSAGSGNALTSAFGGYLADSFDHQFSKGMPDLTRAYNNLSPEAKQRLAPVNLEALQGETPAPSYLKNLGDQKDRWVGIAADTGFTIGVPLVLKGLGRGLGRLGRMVSRKPSIPNPLRNSPDAIYVSRLPNSQGSIAAKQRINNLVMDTAPPGGVIAGFHSWGYKGPQPEQYFEDVSSLYPDSPPSRSFARPQGTSVFAR